MNIKRLQKIYDSAKETERGSKNYYTFDNFCIDAKDYIKDIKKCNVICSMTVSRSGMTRHFNTLHYNMLLNICYNNKLSWDSVKVSGCGMDMHWYLLYRACEDILGYKSANNNYNGKCSSQPII